MPPDKTERLFKFIPGLGNTDKELLSKFCAVYAAAGADIFDLTPDDEVIKAVFDGIRKVSLEPGDFKFCISFSFGTDVHGRKAVIAPEKCTKCGKCFEICPNGAVSENFQIITERCIGCGKCSGCGAVSFRKKIKNPLDFLNSTKYLPDIVELHVNGSDYGEIFNIVKKIKEKFPKIKISLCITRGISSDGENIDIIEKIAKFLSPEKLTVQADGKSMSGDDDSYGKVLQAVAFGQILQNVNADIILSGGCNSRTNECVKLFDINIKGMAAGTFARNLILKYINRQDFWYNKSVFDEAVKIATEFVEREKKC